MTASPKRKRWHRRTFLRGAFGVTFALPFLDGVLWNTSKQQGFAADPTVPSFFVGVRAGNGVAQQVSDEPERFWPMEQGVLSRELMQRQENGDMRSTGALAEHASKLLLVSGTKYNYPGNGCGHSGGGNQCFTGTPPSKTPAKNKSLATGESIDNFIQRLLSPGDEEPLTLASGQSSSYLDEVLSYRQPLPQEINGRLRSAERNPWQAYLSVFGQPGTVSNDFLHNQLVGQRKSVNDLVREQLESIKRNSALSAADHQRLDLHQSSIRDLERKMMGCHLPSTRMGELEGAGKDPVDVLAMTRMMNDIIALSFSCGIKRAATLQVGNGNDSTKYPIGNGSQYSFHWISHRIEGNGGVGSAPRITNAAYMHYLIDKLHMEMFADLITKLDSYAMSDGTTLLDHGVALWTNDLATGVAHSYRNLPYILAGSGGGYLNTGRYIDARDSGSKSGDNWVSHTQLMNTVINAVGVRHKDGSPITDFGHKGGQGFDAARGGEIPGMKT